MLQLRKEELTVLLASVFANVREILTDEQKELLRSIYSEFTDHIDERVDYGQFKVDRWIEMFGTVE